MDSQSLLHKLRALIDKGVVTNEVGNKFKENISKILSTLKEVEEQASDASKVAKELNQTLLGDKIKFEKLSITHHEDVTAIATLERERDAETEAVKRLAVEIEASQIQLSQMEQEKSDLELEVKRGKQENFNLVEPKFREAEESIESFKASIMEHDRFTEVAEADRATYLKTTERLTNEIEQVKSQLQEQKEILLKIKDDPSRMEKQVGVLDSAVSTMDTEIEKIEETISEYNRKLEEQAGMKQEILESMRQNAFDLETNRMAFEQLEVEYSTMQEALALEKSTNQDLLAQKVQIELAYKEEKQSCKLVAHELKTQRKEYDNQKRHLKKSRSHTDNIVAVLPQLTHNLSDVTASRDAYLNENAQLSRKYTMIEQECQVLMENFLRQESLEGVAKANLTQENHKTKDWEAQVGTWMQETHKQAQQISMLNAQREFRTRDLSKARTKVQGAKDRLRNRELSIMDLSKTLNETNLRLREFSVLFKVVKNERNNYVNLIQSSSQALAEMKEKIKILQNEFEILRNEKSAKDQSLAQEYIANQASRSQRDLARMELNKWKRSYKEKQHQVEKQILNIDRLNTSINETEKSMLKLKSQYEIVVEQRNALGLQLLNRNDELCVLFERANMHDTILKNGQRDLAKREDDIRLLQIQVAELERSLLIVQKKIPRVPETQEKIKKLQRDIEFERSETEKLCEYLETPEKDERSKTLPGEDPDIEQLQAKYQVLNDRLGKKRDILLEKDIVLDEITELSNKLKAEAMEGQEQTTILMRQVNDLQSQIKDVTKTMMALVSELSMYEATILKLREDKANLEEALEVGEKCLERNEPPSEDAAIEWQRMERSLKQQLAQDADMSMRRLTNQDDSLAAAHAGQVKTTAKPRPNAYIPENSIGIPKPYGKYAPFKPTEQGASMRHYRRPQDNAIEI